MHIPKKQKGFTLIEILMILTLLGLLGVIALSSYLDTSKTFQFLSNYKEISSDLRTARSLAMTNASVAIPKNEEQTPDRYGVLLDKSEVKVFADFGQAFEYEENEDILIYNKEMTFDPDVYELTVSGSGNTEVLTFPILFFYERGTGEFTAFHKADYNLGATLVSKSASQYIIVKFEDIKNELTRVLVIFQVAGMPEEFPSDPFE